MQNYQIRYQPSSAQLNYLSLHDLGEEPDSPPPSREDFPFSFQEPDFQQLQEEQEDDEDKLQFDQFVAHSLGLDKGVLPLSICRGLKKLMVIVMGEVFEYDHYFHWRMTAKKQKKQVFMLKNKAAILLHLFLLCLLMWIFPFSTIITLALLVLLTDAQKQSSEMNQYEEIPKVLSHEATKLKFFCLAHQSSIAQCQEWHKELINFIIQEVERSENMRANRTTNVMDDLDEIIFRIAQKRSKENSIEYFLNCNSGVSLKLRFWKVAFSNFKMRKLIQVIRQVADEMSHQFSWAESLNENYTSQENKKDVFSLYHSILVHKTKILQKVSSPDQKQKKFMRNVLAILDKQTSLKKILRIQREVNCECGREEVAEEIKNEVVDCPPSLQTLERNALEPVYYEDGIICKYTPEDFRSISEKLSVVLKQHEKKEEKQKQGQEFERKNTENQLSSKNFKLQRKSFGIPILPPSQDLSAYYVE